MNLINNELADLLGTVITPGDFHAAGVCAMHTPLLQVDGVGPIALPLLAAQAEQLIAASELAPYGRGEETRLDTEVRRTWQIGADRVRIEGARWPATLAAIVERAAVGLGAAAGKGVVAQLYKLLVYDAGGFFVRHRDTEKSHGMFATLIVALPSVYAGGELVVRHRGHEVRLDLSCGDPSEAAYAAFYSDCVHEVLPVTSGHRLVLVYNLLRKGRGRIPKPPDYGAETAALTKLLQGWCAGQAWNAPPGPGKEPASDDPREKLVYPLAHAYTPAELSFRSLKGADAAAATVLATAARQSGCELHVALMQIEESGSAEYSSGYRPRGWRRYHDDDDDEDAGNDDEFEVGEVFERSLTLSHWGRSDGSAANFGAFAFTDHEVCPGDALLEMEPDEQHFHEATGNEGASFERSYQRAALVLWPQQQRLQVLARAGLAVTLPYLDALVARWKASGTISGDAPWQEAHELCGHMLRGWPPGTGRHGDEGRSQAAQMLALLARLNDTEQIDAFIAGISANMGASMGAGMGAGGSAEATTAGDYGQGDNAAIVLALRRLSPERACALLQQVLQANADLHIGGCADLLARASTVAEWHGQLRAAARSLFDALPGDPARPPSARDAWRREKTGAAALSQLLRALCRIDSTLAEHAVSHWLAWPKTYGLDSVIVPALRGLADQSALRKHTAHQRLRAAAVQHLQARAALDLAAPTDWRREANLACRCAHCSGLRLFLLDADEPGWRFKAREADRDHVMNSIRQGQCDLDCTVERKGSPHVLVCTKNQASYEARVRQRQADLEDLARLGDRGGA
ncbi:MAG: 2OG-Fe(II) oxygenase [Rubrivivax sp.]|nr:2OG-Fe(II) oxygenase [Rubrivivax sp.]